MLETAVAWLDVGDMAGVGFVFADHGCLVGIDLDGCRNPTTGELAEWATGILYQFRATYAEISPSQKGVKIIAGGRLPTDRTGKRITLPGSHCGIEAYQRRRFFCITGQLVPGHHSTVTACQEQLDWLWAKWIAPNKSVAKPQLLSQADYSILSCDRRKILKRAASYLEKLPPGIQGQNGSGATFHAACELYRFGLTNSEASSLFAQFNGRCVPPWNEFEVAHKLQDAREEVEDAGEFGVRLIEDRRHTSNGSSSGSANGSTSGKSPIRPPLAVNEAEDDPHRLARINLAQYASKHDGRTLRYWRDEWYVWRDTHYRKITEKELRAKIAHACKQEFDRLNLEKLELYEEKKKLGEITPENDQGPPVAKKVTQSLVTNVLQATAGMIVLSSSIEPMTWLPSREIRSLLSMENGILDLDALLTGSENFMLDHTPEWFSMVHLPYAFDPNASCPRWDAFLEHNLEMDPERIKILQEWAGYLLLPDTSEQKFMVLEGEGANGKSVYTAAITAMLGVENVCNQPLEMFGVRFALTETIGKLLNACGDCGEIDKVAEGHLKAFTGGDRMFFDRKGVSGINCVPSARLMISCNNRPRFNDRSNGIWRRLLLIPWNVRVTREKRIKGMDKVEWWQTSGELPGILRWAIVGLDRLRRQGGFTESSLMENAVKEYQEEMNPARTFLNEYVEKNPFRSIGTNFLYSEYRTWALKNGYCPLAEKTFGKEVRRTFPDSKKERAGGRLERHYRYEGIGFLGTKIEENFTEEKNEEKKTQGDHENQLF